MNNNEDSLVQKKKNQDYISFATQKNKTQR